MCIRAIIFEEHCKSQGFWGDYSERELPERELQHLSEAFDCTNNFIEFFKYLGGQGWNKGIFDMSIREIDCPEYFCAVGIEYDARESIDI